MNGSTEHQAFETPITSPRQRIMNLTTAWKMLPLVQRIVADLLQHRQHIDILIPELGRLDRRRRELDWPDRRRRYTLQDEIAHTERQLYGTLEELNQLGIYLIEPEAGRIGFPTLVNNRPAFFAWWPEEEDIRYWHFAEEVRNRSIPTAWLQAEGLTLSEKK